MNNLEKRIIKFAFSLMPKPGFVKKKSLIHYLNIDESHLDPAIESLISNGYIKNYNSCTSHDGECYELTDDGKLQAQDLNKSIFVKIREKPVKSSIFAFLIYLFCYFMDMFQSEIKVILLRLLK